LACFYSRDDMFFWLRQDLFFAVLGSVVRLEIVDDFLCRIIRNRSPIRFYHLVHFGSPGIGRQRRLHSDIPGAVTRIAVGRNFLLAVVSSEHRRVERICRYVVGRARGGSGWHCLADTPRPLQSIKPCVELSIEGGTGEERTNCGDQCESFERSHLFILIRRRRP
jgi:hypothetical protein